MLAYGDKKCKTQEEFHIAYSYRMCVSREIGIFSVKSAYLSYFREEILENREKESILDLSNLSSYVRSTE